MGTENAWRKWGEIAPYHGVLGRGFDSGSMENPEIRARFFALGESHIGNVLDDCASLGPVTRGHALDFGCGVGRLVLPLANSFEKVTGVDISPKMLELARENCSGLDSVEFLEDVFAPALNPKSFDLVHSFIVLQHIRPKDGLKIIRRLSELVKRDGYLAIHFTVGDARRLRWAANQIRYRVPPVQWLNNLRSGLAWNTPVSEMNPYSLIDILPILRTRFADRMVTRSYDQNGHQGVMLVAKAQSD